MRQVNTLVLTQKQLCAAVQHYLNAEVFQKDVFVDEVTYVPSTYTFAVALKDEEASG